MDANNQKNNAIKTVVLFSMIPVIIWLLIAPLSFRFNGMGATLTSIGQITGLAGTVLFSLNLILSTRHKYLEKIYYGMNRAYVNHHLLGGISFIFLMIHPLVLAINYLQFSLELAARFLLPDPGNLAKTYGVIALVLMIILLVLTFYFRPRYDIWKLTHKFLGLAFFLASLHVYFVPSDVSRSPVLRYYMLFFLILGLISIIYRTILGGSRKWKYRVVKLSELATQSIYELELEPINEPMPYESGQFVFIAFRDRFIKHESHPFSISSASSEKNIKFVIKNLGDFTSSIKEVSVGSEARLEGPFGKFNYKNFPNDQIWVAGGIGITPFLGMAQEIISTKNRKATLFYAVNKRMEAVYLDELEKLASVYDNFQVISYVSEEKGRISAEIINGLSAGIKNKDILLCGPPPMMKSLRKQFLDLGIINDNIHSEEFSL
jgi:predicted ferric reductase